MNPCNSMKQLDYMQRNTDLQLSFFVDMLNFAVKTYCYISYIDNSIKYLPSYILHNFLSIKNLFCIKTLSFWAG